MGCTAVSRVGSQDFVSAVISRAAVVTRDYATSQ